MTRSFTKRFAAAGFHAIAPAMFDRVERGVELAYDEDGVSRGRTLRQGIGLDQIVLDVETAADAVRRAGTVGLVGYCWGGSVAWLSACRSGVDAAVGYYGGQIHELRSESPRVPVMLHFGAEDAAIPLDQVEEVRHFALVDLRPEVMASDGVDELRCDSEAITRFLDAAFEDVFYAQFLRHLLNLHRFSLVGER